MAFRPAIWAVVIGGLSLAAGNQAWGQAAPASPGSGPQLVPRQLAPWVLTHIKPVREDDETFSGPRPAVEVTVGIDPNVLNWGTQAKPHFSPPTEMLKAKGEQAIFRRSVWYLDFYFKPLRMIHVDVPQPTGVYERKLIWYMVYKVKNSGYHMSPAPQEDRFGHTTYGVAPTNYSVRFFPTFTLKSHEDDKSKERTYLDQIIPIAVPAIQRREDPAIRLYNSVEIGQIDIPVSDERTDRSVWGVVTWTDVDPQIDFFSIYIQGLTNAFRFADPPGAYQLGNAPLTGRKFVFKTLQLNFWRPGDAVYETEDELRYGMPGLTDPAERTRLMANYGVKDWVAHLWIYQ